MKIVVRYRGIDRYSKRGVFKTLAGAQRFAQKWVGETPELGSFYAVSGDGVGKVTCDGCALVDLFPKLAGESIHSIAREAAMALAADPYDAAYDAAYNAAYNAESKRRSCT